MQLPASSVLIINTIDGILSLSSFDKEDLSRKLHLDAIGNVIDNLSGLSIIGIASGILLSLFLLISTAIRHPKIR